jgi:uncharacterized membrane-anchored protein YitT (DUF2179 family)
MANIKTFRQTIFLHLVNLAGMTVGAFLAALAIRMFLIPNNLIDGGVIGLSLILGRLYSSEYISLYLILLNIPFIFLAWKYIRRSFVFYMFSAIIFFAFFLSYLDQVTSFGADPLEAIVIGGAILGAGAGMIIRYGGCTDGTEILAILINRRKGYTVGQVILFINVFIFGFYGWKFNDWHIALRSLMTYIVAFKTMDLVIAGLEELKSVLIMTKEPESLAKVITRDLGLGLTLIKGRGGFSGEDRDILFIILERLDLAELKEIVLREDPAAFIAIENLHEVAYGKTAKIAVRKKNKKSIHKSFF